MKYDRDHWRMAKLWAAAQTMLLAEWPEITPEFRNEAHRRAGIPLRENDPAIQGQQSC